MLRELLIRPLLSRGTDVVYTWGAVLSLIHPKYKDKCRIKNKSRQGEGFYSQTNLPGLIPRTRREKLLKKNL